MTLKEEINDYLVFFLNIISHLPKKFPIRSIPLDKVKVVFKNRMKNLCQVVIWAKDDDEYTRSQISKVQIQVNTSLISSFKSEQIRDVLRHEVCHVWAIFNVGHYGINHTDKTFKRLCYLLRCDPRQSIHTPNKTYHTTSIRSYPFKDEDRIRSQIILTYYDTPNNNSPYHADACWRDRDHKSCKEMVRPKPLLYRRQNR